MVQAIKRTVTIQPGGRIEVTASELRAGEQAEVIILVPAQVPRKSFRDFLGSGRGAYATPEEADKFLRMLRDEWER